MQERTGERQFLNGNINLYQPSHEHDETASSVSEGNLRFFTIIDDILFYTNKSNLSRWPWH